MAQLKYVRPLTRVLQPASFRHDGYITQEARDTETLLIAIAAEPSSKRSWRAGHIAFTEMNADAHFNVIHEEGKVRSVDLRIVKDPSIEAIQRINRFMDGSGVSVGKYHQTGKVALRFPVIDSKRSDWHELPVNLHVLYDHEEARWTPMRINGEPARHIGQSKKAKGRRKAAPSRRTRMAPKPVRPVSGPSAAETVRSGETATVPHIPAPEPSSALKVEQPEQVKTDPLGIFRFPSVKTTHDIVVSRQVRDELDIIWTKHLKGKREVVALTGPTGTGKTSLAYMLAARKGVGIMKFDVAGARAFEDWTGMTALEQQETVFKYTSFLKAIDADGPYGGIPRIVVLDEANRAQGTSAMNAALPILDGFSSLYIPELGKTVNVDTSVMFILTLNRGSQYGGTVGLDRAFIDRITSQYDLGYLKAGEEVSVVQDRTGLDKEQAMRLVTAANQVRKVSERGDLPEGGGISTRTVIVAAEKVVEGFSLHRAAVTTWLMAYPDEGAGSECETVKSTIEGALRN